MAQQLSSQEWVLVADIGGTNARFAAVSLKTGRDLPDYLVIPTDSTHDFISALEHVIPKLGKADGLQGVVLAIAGPVDGDLVKLTNANWVIDKGKIQQHFSTDKVIVINDFTAISYALPELASTDLHTLQMGKAVDLGHRVVVGPGTGLGVGGLFCAPDGAFHPVVGEGGHTAYAAENEQELFVLKALQEKYGRVSYERVVTGNGLLDMARILGADDRVQSPKDVMDEALQSKCPACMSAFDIFFKGLGRISGDMALTLNATAGVYIAGGIMPRLLPYMDLSPILEAFLDKGRNRHRMQRIPLYLITHSAPAFLGLSAAAKRMLAAA